jgi:glutathione peroxidase
LVRWLVGWLIWLVKGFNVLAFPCSQFANQEPGDEATVCRFAANQYGAKFPIYSKVDVNGANTAPVYKYLKKSFPGDVTWNFSSKFIVNRNGVPVKR